MHRMSIRTSDSSGRPTLPLRLMLLSLTATPTFRALLQLSKLACQAKVKFRLVSTFLPTLRVNTHAVEFATQVFSTTLVN